MSTLQIIQLESGAFKHVDSIDGDFFLGKFYFKQEFNKAFLVEAYGAKRREYVIGDITVFAFGGDAEPFTNWTDLENRLTELGYTGIDTNGIIPTASSYVSSDADNALVLGSDNKLFVEEFTGIQSIVAGTNVTIDDTDPLNPIVNASGGGGATDQFYVVHFGIAKNANYVGAGNWQTPDRNGSTIFNDTSSFGNYYNGTIVTDARVGKVKLPFDCELVDGSFYLTHAGGTNGAEELRIIGFEVSGSSVVGTTTMASATYTQGTTASNGNLGSFSPTTFVKGSFVTYSNKSTNASVYIAEGVITLVFKKI